jgi:hypothetical protein
MTSGSQGFIEGLIPGQQWDRPPASGRADSAPLILRSENYKSLQNDYNPIRSRMKRYKDYRRN